MKKCNLCEKYLPIEEFYRDSRALDRRVSRCRKCINNLTRIRRAKDPERYREYQRKYSRTTERYNKYGITKDDLDNLYFLQDWGCAICGKESDQELHIDHNHETGEVRGLLCGNCNLGLGKFQDSPDLLEKAIKYLKGG